MTGLLKTYRLVLSKADTRYVACADPAERERVRKNFLEKKLGLSGDDLDVAVEATCAAMKADRTKSRLTFYYLLWRRGTREAGCVRGVRGVELTLIAVRRICARGLQLKSWS